MAIANYNEEKPLIINTFKKLGNGEQWLAAQHYCILRKKVIYHLSFPFIFYDNKIIKNDYVLKDFDQIRSMLTL